MGETRRRQTGGERGKSLTPLARPTSVSVVLTVLNGSPWITDQLRAILDQQISVPFDVLVADNGSTDDTIERASAFAESAPVRVLDASAAPGKQFGQRLAVNAARGELIAFADADDVAREGWLEALVDKAAAFDMIGGAFDLDSLNAPEVVASRAAILRRAEGLLEVLGSGIYFPSGANCAIWRSLYRAVDDGTSLPLAEDMDLALRVARAGGVIGFAPEAIMAYRLRSEGHALLRQRRRQGMGQAIIVKKYRDMGVRGDSLPTALRKWALLLPRAAKARLEHDELHWARSELAFALGRLEGSMRFRAMCL